MTLNQSLYSSASDQYETPKHLFDFLNDVFHFELDPCAKPQIEAQKRINTRLRYTEDDDGIIQAWDNVSTFVNPPYSKISKWIDKAMIEFHFRLSSKFDYKAAPIVLLVPARTDTQWFHKIAASPFCKIIFLKGRLKFNNTKTNAPFPSCLIILSSASYLDKLIPDIDMTVVPSFIMDTSKYAAFDNKAS